MPEYAWYLLIAGGIAAVIVALVFGRNLVIRKDGVTVGGAPDKPASAINVASGAKIIGSKTGHIAGIISNGGNYKSDRSIDVLSRAEIVDSEVGDIAAEEHKGT